MKHLESNIQSYNHEAGMGYIHKPTQQKRIEIATRFLQEVLPEARGQKLLSIGCSTGDIETLFLKLGLLVHGIDASPIALKIAQQKGIETVEGDITEPFPYRDESFDFVFAGEVIEHVMHTRDFLSEIHRVLKPQGRVIITTPNLARIEDRMRFLLGKSPKHTTPIHDYLYLHIRPFTLDSLERALEFTGFAVERRASNYVYFGPLKTGQTSRMLAQLFPSLGKTLIVRGRKT